MADTSPKESSKTVSVRVLSMEKVSMPAHLPNVEMRINYDFSTDFH